jgi:hypothetical protein
MRHWSAVLLFLISQLGDSPPLLSEFKVALLSGSSPVGLSKAQSAHLSARLNTLFQTCHPMNRGGVVPQETLTSRWAEQERTVHAVLHVTYGPDSPSHLSNRALEVLFGFPPESNGLGPIIAREPGQPLKSYFKCSGLEHLLLACYVHRLVPGVQPSSRCQELEDLHVERHVEAQRRTIQRI